MTEETSRKWYTLADYMRDRAAREAREAAWHPLRRALVRAGRYLRRPYGLRRALSVRRHAREARWMWQRARRGWSDADVWSLDSYAARVLGEGIRQLAETGHTWPGDSSPWPTPEAWTSYLKKLAADLSGWNDDTFLDNAAFERARAAFEEIGKNAFGHLWD